jgi:hypothetical protein
MEYLRHDGDLLVKFDGVSLVNAYLVNPPEPTSVWVGF